MDKHSFFQAAMKSVISLCEAHDLNWQERRRKVTTWLVLRFLVVLIGENGLQQGLAEFDLKKKLCLLPRL